MSEQTWNIGDEVMPNPATGWGPEVLGVKYIVTKQPAGARGVNYTARRADGGLKGLRFKPDQVIAYSDDRATATVVPFEAGPMPGSVVTVDQSGVDPNRLWYVEGPARSKVNASKLLPLGESDGRYFPSMPNRRIKTVAPPEGGWTLTGLGLTHGD